MLTRHEQERLLDEQIARMIDEQEQIMRVSQLTPVDSYHADRGITGVPSNANRTYRVAQSSWLVHHEVRSDGTLRAVGNVRAVGGDVKVIHSDGTVEIRGAGSFRRQRDAGTDRSRGAAKVQNDAQARRLALLASAGNASDYNN